MGSVVPKQATVERTQKDHHDVLRGVRRHRCRWWSLGVKVEYASISLAGSEHAHYVVSVKPQLELTALDCPDPLALADFYARVTGMEIEPLDGEDPGEIEWVRLLNEGMPTLAFQRVENYVAPTWPEGPVPQQLHLDFIVDDLDEGERHILEQGATKHSFQPGADQPGDTFRVYLDPVGHPFCLVLPY